MKLKEKGKKTIKLKKKLTAREAGRISVREEPRSLYIISAAVRIGEAVVRVLLSVAFLGGILLLLSCSSIYGYSEPEDRYIVSALGFDEKEGSFEVSVSVVDGEETRVFRGIGDSVDHAMSHIKGADAKQLELSHLAVIVIGNSIDDESLSEVLAYCQNNDDITIGVRLASAHNAAELLSLDGSDGYTLTGAFRDGKDGSGFAGGSRFYELENDRISDSRGRVCHMPYFSVGEEGYYLDGLKIYGVFGWVRLDRVESAYYMMLRGEFSAGPLDMEYGGEAHGVLVSSCHTLYRYEDGRIGIVCKLGITSEYLSESDASAAMKACSDKAESLCRQLFDRYGDIMGIGKRIGLAAIAAEDIFVECKIE